MRTLASILAVLGMVVLLGTPAQATITTYEFSFTAEDMLSYVTVDGTEGSSAADNEVFDGARLRRDGTNPSGPLASRSYWESQNGAFTSWATGTTDRFLSFNIWGFDGRGIHWGEDFKPHAWVGSTEPAGWTPWTTAWPWGDPPAGSHTDLLLGWDANGFGDGFNFQDTDLGSKAFSFMMQVDDTDAWWGQNTQGAPNDYSVPELTIWFGGWFDDDYFEDPGDYYMYEGNMVVQGRVVPEPGTIGLLGLGLVGLGVAGWWRKRRG